MTTDSDWLRVIPQGMVPPHLPNALRGGTTGTVKENGLIEIADIDGTHLKLKPHDNLPPGTDVVVRRKRGAEWCRPKADHEAEKTQHQVRHEKKARAKSRVKAWRRRRAEQFWDEYGLPFEYDVGIKGRRSGLLRGSSGDGTDSRTVTHLYVAEAFSEERIERDGGVYLCHPGTNAKFKFEGERRTDSEGDEYLPRVTCLACRERMKRWLITEAEDDDD